MTAILIGSYILIGILTGLATAALDATNEVFRYPRSLVKAIAYGIFWPWPIGKYTFIVCMIWRSIDDRKNGLPKR